MTLIVLTVFATFLSVTARAQETWTTASSATGQNLWGVTYGGGQFVAVGENATILTSIDGTAWTARSTGATWLLAVAYSAELQRYVAIGDQGTVLTSSDAVTWTARTSGTTQRLNGIAANSDLTASASTPRFLAVGEAGTVLTSSDGLAWTPRTIPAFTGWLRGVTFGAGRFVIAGQARTAPTAQATVFTTIDGTQFDPANANLSNSLVADLEALAFDGTRFVVAGRNLAAISPATFPLSWQTRLLELSGLSTPPFHYFRGVTFFNNTWIAVGALSSSGTTGNTPIVFGQLNSPSQNAANIPSTASFNAITTSPSVAIAVGQAGLIMRSVNAPSAPRPFLLASSSVIASVGTTVNLAADATGSAPLSYQWNFNGTPLAGATTSTLTLPAITFAQTGSYTLTASNALGTATSSAYFLTVVSPLPLTSPVDPNFTAAITGTPGLIAVQADGKILVNAPTTPISGAPRVDLARLNADGSLDTSFTLTPNLTLRSIEVLADGRILIGATDANYLRLNSDGTTDATFSAVRLTGAHRVLADGRILHLTISGNVATLTRFTSTGSPDASYPATTVTLAPPNNSAVDPNYRTAFTALDPQGRVLVAASSYEQVGTGVFYRNESKIFRLGADGVLDASFPTATVAAGISQFVSTGGKLYYVSSVASALGSNVRYTVARLNADGSADPSYHPISLDGGIPVFPIVRLSADGSVYFSPANIKSLVRYDSEGVRDAEFSARFSEPVTFSFSRLVPIDGGRLLATGNFTQFNGVLKSFLVRLLPDLKASATRLTNLSVRQLAGTDSQTLIVGFVLAGQGSKTLLLRGIGPTLSAFGIASPAADPRLALYDSSGTLRLANDNWSDSADASAIASTSASSGAFALPVASKDSAALATLPEGAFTMQIGVAGVTGVALAEGYDTGGMPPNYAAARVVNFSARANSTPGAGNLIVGFTVSGPNVKRILIRALGPALTQFGVTGAMTDPLVTLYNATAPIAANSDWGDIPGVAAELTAAFAATGAFPLPASSKDAALLVALPPGSYSAVVFGNNSTSGIALVEVYEVP